jgi:hypothetical protein
MTVRYLQKKTEVEISESLAEFKPPIELEYYLLENDGVDYIEELKGEKVYGIEIVKKETYSDRYTNTERELIKNFSCCKKDTESVLNKLAKNFVTPIELRYVVDDIIGE